LVLFSNAYLIFDNTIVMLWSRKPLWRFVNQAREFISGPAVDFNRRPLGSGA